MNFVNIAEAKAHLLRIIERVERGETITIARNNHAVATLAPIRPLDEAVLAAFAALRQRAAGPIRKRGESWRDVIHEGHDR